MLLLLLYGALLLLLRRSSAPPREKGIAATPMRWPLVLVPTREQGRLDLGEHVSAGDAMPLLV